MLPAFLDRRVKLAMTTEGVDGISLECTLILTLMRIEIGRDTRRFRRAFPFDLIGAFPFFCALGFINARRLWSPAIDAKRASPDCVFGAGSTGDPIKAFRPPGQRYTNRDLYSCVSCWLMRRLSLPKH